MQQQSVAVPPAARAAFRSAPFDPERPRARVRARIEGIARDPRTWGRGAWRLMFAGVLANYPAAVRTRADAARADAVLRSIEGIVRLLPCDECRREFARRLRDHPVRGTRAELSRWGVVSWLYDAKDAVNRRIGAPASPEVLEDAVESLVLHDWDPAKRGAARRT